MLFARTLCVSGNTVQSALSMCACPQFVREYYSIEHHEAWAGKMAKDVKHISNIHYKYAGERLALHAAEWPQ